MNEHLLGLTCAVKNVQCKGSDQGKILTNSAVETGAPCPYSTGSRLLTPAYQSHLVFPLLSTLPHPPRDSPFQL